MSTKMERYDEALRWLRANGHDLAPLTGTDVKTLLAIDALWRLRFGAGGEAPHIAFRAITTLLHEHALQEKHWYLAIELVARYGDWSDVEPVRRELARWVKPDDHHWLQRPENRP